ncbi:Oxidoreductase molybdopterin binding domain-containing protein [Capnocytophaga haemolytica]|jgi:hypothetical protein|uniref:Oxidoreductase molybdopterin binding domain n=1 Tax=Capnocytophaga haemolytica TaxID=45243 RepID=A0AAX2GXS9_9FLAO|nr:molybdopterin-dependent oxidoreductase [Capnocytophaga haemolytica]SFN73017.1 Oxidoreductase molybdopterin binding domain-containing protein [Capnocytophaga haemolytica]SNV07863.1 Oxidoreductase molybdopterin binding domain [Capnocytophaga haemolytica]
MKKRTIQLFLAGLALSLALACNNTQQKQATATPTTEQEATSEHQHPADTMKTDCGVPFDGGGKESYISHEVKVVGEVENPMTLTVDKLKKMNVHEIKNKQIICSSGENRGDIHTAKGVLLKEILFDADIKQKDHKDRNFFIVARATDGFTAGFSWAELFNSPNGEQAYVIFEENGKPLTEKGEMIVMSFNDTKTGPRHVMWLKTIEVHRIP